jgi:hypothetical protein
MKAYTVKQNRYDFYYGQLIDTRIIGYYTNKATADKVAADNTHDDYHTLGDAYVEEITINED